jgi:hypothetical protein
MISVIIDSLKEYILSITNNEDDIRIDSFEILDEMTESCNKNWLYITKSDNIPLTKPAGLSVIMVISGNEDIPPAYSKERILLLRSDTDILQMIGILKGIFSIADETSMFTSKLLSAVNSGKNMQQLLDMGNQELGNPLLLVDVALCFVAHSGGSDIVDEPLWDWTLSQGYVTEEYADYVMENESPPSNHTSDEYKSRLIWQEGLLHHRQLVGKVIHNGIPLGYLKLLEYNQPITAEAANKLTVLCEFIALFMSSTANFLAPENTLIETFLTSMLTQKLYDKNAIEERVHKFRLKLYENLNVIVISAPDLSLDKLYFLKKKLKNFLARETIVLFQGNLVLLYDRKSPDVFTTNELKNFDSLMNSFGVRAGISNVFEKVHCFEEHYRQALTAIELSESLHSINCTVYYDDVCILHMINVFAEHNELSTIIHPSILQLKKHDETNSAELSNTLLAYLNNSQDIVRTAAKLHVHYNTLKYRLQKLTALTNIDLNDNDLLFRLRLSFMVYDYMTAKKRNDTLFDQEIEGF